MSCIKLVSMFTKHYIHCNIYQLHMTGCEHKNLLKTESFIKSLQKNKVRWTALWSI